MKTKSLIIALTLVVTIFTSCDHDNIRAEGEVTSLDYSIPEYSTLKVSDAFNVYVSFSDTEESIRIDANDNLHDKIVVKRDGDKLIIRLKTFTNVRGNATLNAYISTKNIESFDLGGASRVILENEWNVSKANIELSGASDFTGEIAADRLNLDMSGASNVDLFGVVSIVDADLSGSSDIKDYDLEIQNLRIDLSGASEAFLSVSESIDIEASGASTLNYKGDASITHKDLSGASEIKNRN